MGNKSSSTSKAQYSSNSQGEKVASTQLQYVAAPHPRKISTNNPKDVSQTQQHGKKPLGNDEAFTTYIKDARVKMKSKSNIGVHHEDRNNVIPVDVANETNKEYEKDHFSDFIQNARKKLRTVTRRSSSIRRGA
ncbi:hypothetical protein JHK82_024760 [Glycine max]|nr:hypothetical protein JHK82_024760 [Glycine max]